MKHEVGEEGRGLHESEHGCELRSLRRCLSVSAEYLVSTALSAGDRGNKDRPAVGSLPPEQVRQCRSISEAKRQARAPEGVVVVEPRGGSPTQPCGMGTHFPEELTAKLRP